MSLQTTSSQTIGPYLHIGLTWLVTDNLAAPGVSGEKVAIEGRIVDGAGNAWFYGDVAIRDGKIAAVGDLRTREAREVIDAKGLIVAPGFIDVHTHVDNDIIRAPSASQCDDLHARTAETPDHPDVLFQ